MSEQLFRDVAQFDKDNPDALKEAEQWLDDNDFECLNEAWELASVSRDWKRILYIANQCSKDLEMAYAVLYQGSYTTSTHPSNLIIRNALEEGKTVVEIGSGDVVISQHTDEGWYIESGQVFYNGNDLCFPPGLIQEVLLFLIGKIGYVSTNEELERKTPRYRHYIGQIKQILNEKTLPFDLETVWGEGYKFQHKLPS